MEIRLANKLDKNELYALWQEAFGDDENTIDLFFNTAVEYDNVPVISENGEIFSALYLIETEIVKAERSYGAYYVYAAATKKSQRKKGLMAKLLKYSEQLAKKRNIDCLFLRPETEKLYNYYEKQGFKTAFFEKKEPIEYKGEEISDYSFVNWDEKLVSLDCEFQDCGFFKCRYGFAQLDKTGNTVSVNYFVGSNANGILNETAKSFEGFKILVRIPAEREKGKKTGMIKAVGKNAEGLDNIYLGLTLQ